MESIVKSGAWKTNITPPIGISTAGSFSPVYVQEIIDELYSNAIVIDDGTKEITIVSVDVCAIPDDILKDIIVSIEKDCNIKQENIIIAATHNHTGPNLGELFIGIGEEWPDYIENFKKCVTSSVVMAQKRKQTVKVAVGSGRNDKCISSRRLKKPDGTLMMNWHDKKILQDCIEGGPTDQEVVFVVFEDLNGNPLTFIVNYANHNNAMGGVPFITGDWAGYIGRVLARVYGDNVITLFLAGACGDVNWIKHQDLSQKHGYPMVKKIGTSIAGTIMENLATVEYIDFNTVDVTYRKMIIKDRPFCDNDTLQDNTFGYGDGAKRIIAQYELERKQAQDKELALNEINIHAVRIGKDIAIITNPGELFTEYGLKIKAKSPFKYTIVSELTNGYAGYICTREAFSEGGYETRKTNRSSHLEVNAGEKIVNESIKLLNEIFNSR